MKYKILSLGGSEAQQESPPGILEQAAGLGGSLLKGAAAIPTSIVDLTLAGQQALRKWGGSETLSPREYENLQLTSKVKQAIEKHVPFADVKPTGIMKYTHKLAEALPAFYAPGGGFVNAVTRTLGSEAGREFAKSIDLDEFGQFIGSVAGASLAAGTMTPSNLRRLADKNYDAFEASIPKGAKVNAVGINQAVKNIDNMDLIKADRDIIKEALEKVEPWTKLGHTGIQQAWKDKKYVQELIRRTPNLSSRAEGALQELSKSIISDISAAKSNYPNLFTQGLIEGDSIYYGLQNLSPIRKFLRKWVTPQVGLGVAAGEVLGPQHLKELVGGIPAKVYAAGIGARGLSELVEPAFKSLPAAKYIVGKTIPQVAAGVTLTKEPSKAKPKYKLISI